MGMEIITVHNRRLAQWRVTWLNESFPLRNPPLRQAPNRYV